MVSLSACLCPLIFVAAASAETAPPANPLATALKWRMIGPYRGGRTRAVAGVPSKPNVFYIGAVDGGVWRTDDARSYLATPVRRSANPMIRRDRRRAVRPKHNLCGQW